MNFQEFQSLYESCSLKITNHYLKDLFQKLKFYKIKENDQDFLQTFKEKVHPDIVIISGYTDPNIESQYINFILCFNYNIIIYQSTNILSLYPFFSENKESKIYYISESIQPIIQQFEKLREDFHLNLIKDDRLISSEIQRFMQSFIFRSTNTKQQIFLITIFQCISAYLIKIAYYNSKINRFINNNELFSKNVLLKEMKQEEFIELRNIDSNDSSSVLLCYHIPKEQVYAIKIFNELFDGKKLFKRERDNYMNINHPLIPRYYGTIKMNSNNYCLIMEYIEGKSLNEIDSIHLPQKIQLKIIFEMMVITEYLHYNNYVYRDLKPDNFIIDENYSVFLIDFDRM